MATAQEAHATNQSGPTGAGQRLLLTRIRWPTYEALLQDAGDRPIRLSYDRGKLEIMILSREHEVYKWLLGQFVVVLADEFNLRLAVGGSMTFRREDLERGLEPDECFWIENEGRVRGRLELDFIQDPPPDLALEVEVTHSLVDRLGIYAALRIPEIWRFDGTTVRAGLLQPDGQYLWGDSSPRFPGLALSDFVPFLHQWQATDHLSIVRAFRAWVRQRLSPPGNPPP